MRTRLAHAMVLICVGFAIPALAQDATRAKPCSAPEYSQFDFWVGEWRVTDESGTFQGTNRIVKILGGCALQENWNGAQGMRGHSFNIYAARRGTWHQTWVDSNGGLLLLDGGLEDGRMVLSGQTPAPDGPGTVEHEISWESLPEGRVRQLWRISRDGGTTWNDAFVGIYSRKE
jgi:hypothetical protein